MNTFKEVSRNDFEEMSASEFVKRGDVLEELKDEVKGMFSWSSEAVKDKKVGADNVMVRLNRQVRQSVSIDFKNKEDGKNV